MALPKGAEARLTGAGFRAPAELSLKRERGVLEAVARAVAHVAERRTAVPEAEIRAVALGHAPGRYTLAEVDAAIARLVSVTASSSRRNAGGWTGPSSPTGR